MLTWPMRVLSPVSLVVVMIPSIGILPQSRESDAESLRKWRKTQAYRAELEAQIKEAENKKGQFNDTKASELRTDERWRMLM
jgi:hypothetical protein